jgi:glycosyltransferase involved in cell wall biosynthesis
MHAGLPQLTMNFPEYKRINDEYEIAVLIDDIRPDVVAKALNLLISDTALYQQLKENCMKAKQVLNWQNEEKKLVAFYQMVLN